MPGRRAASLDRALRAQARPTTTRRCARALREISVERPRWGYRRAHALLVEEGWEVNRKRVQRVVARGGAAGAAEAAQAPAAGRVDRAGQRLAAERPNHVWALDYQHDQTADGRVIRLLNIVDEFTREALAMHVARSIDADKTVERAGAPGRRARRPERSCDATTARS